MSVSFFFCNYSLYNSVNFLQFDIEDLDFVIIDKYLHFGHSWIILDCNISFIFQKQKKNSL